MSKLLSFPKNLLRKPLEFFRVNNQIKSLSEASFGAKFINEGGMIIQLPEVRNIDFFDVSKSEILHKTIAFSKRPNSEALLRNLVFELFNLEFIDSKKSVIDIGGWIGDNTLVWAKMLTGTGVVYSIDPSKENLDFINTIAEINEITNIVTSQAICSDVPNSQVQLADGSMEHARFTDATNSSTSMLTSTLSSLIPEQEHSNIGLLHVDVEGFEEKVLKGALTIIERSRPIIIFEQHIDEDNIDGIVLLLKSNEYQLFMINEVLPGCNLDCRNFVAFPSDHNHLHRLDLLLNRTNSAEAWSAIPGQSLLHINY